MAVSSVYDAVTDSSVGETGDSHLLSVGPFALNGSKGCLELVGSAGS
jgi:hypothetical protein